MTLRCFAIFFTLFFYGIFFTLLFFAIFYAIFFTIFAISFCAAITMELQEKLNQIQNFLEEIVQNNNIAISNNNPRILKPTQRYISSVKILEIFNISKDEFNNILVRI